MGEETQTDIVEQRWKVSGSEATSLGPVERCLSADIENRSYETVWVLLVTQSMRFRLPELIRTDTGLSIRIHLRNKLVPTHPQPLRYPLGTDFIPERLEF